MKAYYDLDSNSKSRGEALLMRDQYPDQVYGYDWAVKNDLILDSVRKDSILLPDAVKLFEFAQKDTVKFRSYYITSLRVLSDYYINKARDKETSLIYFQKWHDIDTANAPKIQELMDQIKKMPPAKPPAKGNTKTGSPKPAAIIKPKTKTTKAIVKN
jgi:hypothetical protein